ncbi:FlgM family anti-sigma-28 factor [Hypnocyclicus thermotrophus]|uniref:FlgM family anti-sigma-28 factor n=1 Tax=Hypnocyclicus thermotrophus TaxID=1627895 RepID=A0AA46DXF1_9FUSO|nr:flagellar biosynthesis anti-sigma factor FlgM [Hypnocyclicus thermotrophus]TDT68077.1 FlgM family anti-sigma-28 factor [Hypnocyclicus thermotrophus]
MMKIVGNINSIYGKYTKDVTSTKKANVINNNKKVIQDKVDISFNAKKTTVDKAEVNYLKAKLNASGERSDKIADIKSRIEAGTYNVSLDKLADAILNSKRG